MNADPMSGEQKPLDPELSDIAAQAVYDETRYGWSLAMRSALEPFAGNEAVA